MNSLNITRTIPQLYFILIYDIAIQTYIAGRLNLIWGLHYPGLFCAHQSLELLIKSIMKLEKDKHKEGHKLRDLMSEAAKTISDFSEITNDVKRMEFLGQLTLLYEYGRYGEAEISTKIDDVIDNLDYIIYRLWRIHTKTIKGLTAKIAVPFAIRDKFLERNNYFNIKDISEFPINFPGA